MQCLLLLWLLAQAKWWMNNSTTYLRVPEVVQNQMHTIQRTQRRCQVHCCPLSNNKVLYYKSMAEPKPLIVQSKRLGPPLPLRGHILFMKRFDIDICYYVKLMLVFVLCRSEVTMHSAKRTTSSVSTSLNMKRSGAKSILSARYHTYCSLTPECLNSFCEPTTVKLTFVVVVVV